MSSDAVITVHNLSKSYKLFRRPEDRLRNLVYSGLGLGRAGERLYDEVWAVRGVSFSVPRGKTFGIVGRNGSGKSTLLQMVCGVLPPTTGEVVVKGRVTALLELAAGFNPEFSGRENARFNAALFGLSESEIERKIAEIEAFAEIGQYFDQPVKTYSSGMYVRVGFAVQACIDPDVLIVDEALAVGDARFQAKCMARIKSLKERGTSILFVSHDIGSVRGLCDEALWLDRGFPRMVGDVASVTSAYMEHLFVGDRDPAVADRGDEAAATVEDAIVDPPPIQHWGTRLGTIVDVRLENAQQINKRSFQIGECMRVRIDVDTGGAIDLMTLGVAFSIKNKRSEDLIVGTSWNDGRISFDAYGDSFSIVFELPLWLTAGEYLVSVAAERRVPHQATEYYEYLDGRAMFTLSSGEHRFGVFAPPMQRIVSMLPR